MCAPVNSGTMKLATPNHSSVSAPSATRMTQNSVDATWKASRLRPFWMRSVNTGTNAADSAACENRLLNRFGTCEARVNADIAAVVPKNAAPTTSRPSPARRESAVATAKIAVLTAIRRRAEAAPSARTRLPRCPKAEAGVRSRRWSRWTPVGYSTDGRGSLPAAFGLLMANIHSQKKRIERAARERLENRRYTSRVKTYFRRLEAAAAAGDDATADTEHRALVQAIDKAVKGGAIHRNNGARKKSRAARVRRGAARVLARPVPQFSDRLGARRPAGVRFSRPPGSFFGRWRASSESAGTGTDRIFFELDQFEVSGEDRLEVRGRWFGVRGRRFVRPTLLLRADGTPRRALADLEHKPWFAEDGEPWEAVFSCGVDGAEVREAELAVAPDIAVALPAPNGRRRNPTRIPAQSERRPGTPRGQSARGEPRRDDVSIARQEIERLKAELEASNAARLEAHGERDHARAERDEIAAERDRVAAERDELRRALTRERATRDEARAALAHADAAREEAQATYARLAEARDQALNERSDRARRAGRDDPPARHRRTRARGGGQAASAGARRARRVQSELDAQLQAMRELQSEREAELATRGAAMVMRGAHRAAPVKADWTTRAIAITVLVIAVLAALLIVHAL